VAAVPRAPPAVPTPAARRHRTAVLHRVPRARVRPLRRRPQRPPSTPVEQHAEPRSELARPRSLPSCATPRRAQPTGCTNSARIFFFLTDGRKYTVNFRSAPGSTPSRFRRRTSGDARAFRAGTTRSPRRPRLHRFVVLTLISARRPRATTRTNDDGGGGGADARISPGRDPHRARENVLGNLAQEARMRRAPAWFPKICRNGCERHHQLLARSRDRHVREPPLLVEFLGRRARLQSPCTGTSPPRARSRRRCRTRDPSRCARSSTTACLRSGRRCPRPPASRVRDSPTPTLGLLVRVLFHRADQLLKVFRASTPPRVTCRCAASRCSPRDRAGDS